MKSFLRDKHIEFLFNLEKNSSEFEYHLMAHLQVNGIYWGSTALALLSKQYDRNSIIKTIMDCYLDGGFSGSVGHDAHLLNTLSAVQVLILYDALSVLDIKAVAKYIASLQNNDGSFSGDSYGETDTRFSYCAVSCLALLGCLDVIDSKKAIEYVVKCQNMDGGFGSVPGAESHAGQIFCCVGVLCILDSLHLVDADKLGWWLSERQLPNGGLNGRPEKLEDVCYSWWVLSSLEMLGKREWINGSKLIEFILSTQDEEEGGMADRPGNMVDVFHTLFGICALSLLGYEGLEKVDARFCLPKSVTEQFQYK